MGKFLRDETSANIQNQIKRERERKHILLDVLDTVHAKRRRTAAATSRRTRTSRRRGKTRSNARADTKDGEAGNILAAETLGSGTYREEHHTTQCYRRRGSNLAGA